MERVFFLSPGHHWEGIVTQALLGIQRMRCMRKLLRHKCAENLKNRIAAGEEHSWLVCEQCCVCAPRAWVSATDSGER